MKGLLFMLMGVALTYGAKTPPTSVSQCFDHKAPSDAMKAKFEQMHTCAEACLTAAGIKPNTAHKTCFEAAKTSAKAFFTGNAEIQTNKANFQKCVTSTCTKAQPQSSGHHEMEHSSSHTYNDSNPFDHKRCAGGLLMQVMKGSAPEMSSAVKSTLHTCMEACHPEPAGTEQSSHKEGHHRRHSPMQRNIECLKHFCSKSDFQTCRPAKDATLEASVHSFMEKQFSTLCSCVGGSADQCTVNTATCTALFNSMEQKHAARKAAHSSSG